MQLLAFLDPDFLWLLFRSLWPFWLLIFALGFVCGFGWERWSPWAMFWRSFKNR